MTAADALHGLRERYTEAVDRLVEKAASEEREAAAVMSAYDDDAYWKHTANMRRYEAKAEGVRLALSLLDEAERQAGADS